MSYRVKTNYDRGYVNAMDKVRVFIESNQKVMYVNTDEYKNAKNARSAYLKKIFPCNGNGADGCLLQREPELCVEWRSLAE